MAESSEPLKEIVARALAEDVGAGDVTTEATVPADARARARIVQKEAGVAFGFDLVEETMRQCGVEHVDRLVVEGQWRDGVPAEVLLASGPAAALLVAERTALNFLGHLSGIATLTARFVEAVAGTGAHILDTRKTTPGLRALEKAAVAAGGGRNHRLGLYDAILIKENHIALAGGVAKAIYLARKAQPQLPSRSRSATSTRPPTPSASAPTACCSTTWTWRPCAAPSSCATRTRRRRGPPLEASGGVDLDTVRAIAETGVDFISIGALTHSAPSLDFSLLLEPA